MNQSPFLRNAAFAVPFVLIWTSAFPAAKIGLIDSPPLLFLAFRFLLAGGLMLAWAHWRGTLRMLSHQRFDYTFEYPSTVVNYARSNPESVPLRSVTLADAADLQVVGSYCTRNAWGRAMALRIDAAVRARLSQPEPVLALYRHWLPVESYQAYGAGIEAYLRQRAEQPLTQMLAGVAAELPAAAEPQAQSLEGVQTPDKALQQDDVDDLLASLGF